MTNRYTVRNYIWVARLALCFAAPGALFAQTLPWKTQSEVAQPSENPVPSHHHGHKNTHTSSPTASNSERSLDDRKLDELATKYYAVSSKDPEVVSKLKQLQSQVWKYRQELDSRSYDAADIIKDTKKLEWRIKIKLKKLETSDTSSGNKGSSPPAPHDVR